MLAGVLGLLLLAGAAVWWSTARPLGDFGAVGGPAPGTSAPPPAPSRSAAPAPAPGPTTEAPPPGGDATLPGEPVLLTIPSQQVTADVVPVDVHGGVLDVPEDIHQVGWWTGSALAGAAEGTTVLDGHVDSAVAGEGALFRLGDLRAGDPLLLDTAARRVRYTVTARRVIVKVGALPAEFFADAGPHRLVVISCGGPFDRATRSYRDNVVVVALPAS